MSSELFKPGCQRSFNRRLVEPHRHVPECCERGEACVPQAKWLPQLRPVLAGPDPNTTEAGLCVERAKHDKAEHGS